MKRYQVLLSGLFLTTALVVGGGANSASAQDVGPTAGACGNGNPQPSQNEQCDEGALNGTAGSCCNADCTYKTAGSTCGSQSTGECDAADTCNATGVCLTNADPIGTPCGSSSDTICDNPDTCDGSGACSPNYESSATVCRAIGGVCDVAETCDGAGACPTDSKEPSTTVCRAAAGICDVGPENCTGSTNACPADVPQNAGSVCRPSGGVCDPQEVCDGVSGACPTDARSSAVCRASAGVCDVAETCDGDVACPNDEKQQAETVCRASAGVCDQVEVCDGVTDSCGADAKEPSTTECRASAGICDVGAEFCTGNSNNCPADVPQNEGTVCRAAAGGCDVAEACDGVSGACPNDAKVAADTECRPAAGDCDVAEACDGETDACPDDALRASDYVCREAVNPACDVEELCTGSDVNCPDDELFNCGDSDGIDCTEATCMPDGECVIAENCIEICRGAGFWQTHSGWEKDGPNVGAEVFGDVGSVDVCGVSIWNTYVWDYGSLLEGVCVRTQGVKLRQLNRQLLTAAMNCQVSEGGDCDTITGRFIDVSFDACNDLCNDLRTGSEPAEDAPTLAECKDQLQCFNGGGRMIDGQCAYGTCAEDTETYCGGDYGDCPLLGEDTQACVRFDGNCAKEDLCSEDNDAPATICPDSGPATSPKSCRDARKSWIAIDNY